MRLLFVNYEFPPVGGGASFASVALARELVRLGHDVGFLTADQDDGSRDDETLNGFQVHRVRGFRRGVHDVGMCGAMSFICSAAARLPRIVTRGGYDACHYYFGLPTGLLSRVPGSHRDKPYVVSLRGSDVPGYEPRLDRWHRALLPITRRIWRGAYRVVANSDGLRKLAWSTVPAQPIDVIPNGIETLPRKRPSPAAGDGIRILTVSRLIERKGLDTLIEAVAEIPDTAVKLDIAGEGPSHARLERLARERGIGDRVRFHGFVQHEDLAELYARADIFVLPSRAESCSMALLEAMGAGLPVVATRVGGTPELIGDGKNGLLIGTDDSSGLAVAIRQLIAEPRRRAEFSAENLRLARDRFSWNSTARRYEEIFRAAIEPAHAQ